MARLTAILVLALALMGCASNMTALELERTRALADDNRESLCSLCG